jgi:hypothetical protein
VRDRLQLFRVAPLIPDFFLERVLQRWRHRMDVLPRCRDVGVTIRPLQRERIQASANHRIRAKTAGRHKLPAFAWNSVVLLAFLIVAERR